MKERPLQKSWQLLAKGDEHSLYECFHLFYDDLYRFGISLYKNKELAREGIQDLFIELWQIRQKLSSVNNMQEYVLTIYKRILYKTYLKQKKNAPAENDPVFDLTEESFETALMDNQEVILKKRKLLSHIDQLPARQKQIIQLRFFEELSIDEIAEKTSLTERTVYNTLYNALQALREVMAALIFVYVAKDLPLRH
ncbi:RNA polymerase sigma factor [Pinibacter aurantiacus]|uniref:Sigma-70 family RNA polymerase sigma factor n=1 Tax=Pinibacter aurantiacus TaxID=2851599 RepID=A0A9E2SC39_9BACT|nr:sigma-70 family RNA polymerase sigma factor [Pinibacter aurantiacus]MBV4360353.1 sigma-70 family RNA polymerase sigma factor [Pinibacter aurantiacus]